MISLWVVLICENVYGLLKLPMVTTFHYHPNNKVSKSNFCMTLVKFLTFQIQKSWLRRKIPYFRQKSSAEGCQGSSVGKALALHQRGSGFESRQDVGHDPKISVTKWDGIFSGESGWLLWFQLLECNLLTKGEVKTMELQWDSSRW